MNILHAVSRREKSVNTVYTKQGITLIKSNKWAKNYVPSETAV